MYICDNCKHIFEEPAEQYDFTSECWGAPVTHSVNVCPNCGSDEIDEMDKCDVCGEYIAPGEGVCDNCRGLIRDIVGYIRHRVNYTAMKYNLTYEELMYRIIEDL